MARISHRIRPCTEVLRCIMPLGSHVHREAGLGIDDRDVAQIDSERLSWQAVPKEMGDTGRQG